MRVRDPTRKSLLEFHGPVFPIDVTGQEVIQCPVFLSIRLNEATNLYLIPDVFCQRRLKSKRYEIKTTFPAGDAQRQVPGYERPTGFLSIHMLRLEQELFTPY